MSNEKITHTHTHTHTHKNTFLLHGKNDFVKVFKNLTRYESEKNVVWIIKIIM